MRTLAVLSGILVLGAVAAQPPTPTTLTKTVQRETATGYSKLVPGPGESRVVRNMFPNLYPYLSSTPIARNPLVSFAQISDLHIMDEESPLRIPFMDRKAWIEGVSPVQDAYGTDSAYRPHEMLTAQLTDSIARAIRNVGPAPATGRPLDFTLVTGDAVDNMQYNETRWYINVLDGATDVRPTSVPLTQSGFYRGSSHVGAAGSIFPCSTFDYYYHPEQTSSQQYNGFPRYIPDLYKNADKQFQAAGLGMKWYAAVGNHDVTVQGNLPKDALDGVFSELAANIVLDASSLTEFATGSKELCDIYGLRPKLSDYGDYGHPALGGTEIHAAFDYITNNVTLGATQTTSSNERRLLSKPTFIAEHFNTIGSPAGHGFAAGSDKAYYSIPSSANDQIQFIALDTTNNLDFGPHGQIDDAQFAWLEAELKAHSSRYRPDHNSASFVTNPGVQDKLIVLFGHHTLATMSKIHKESELVGYVGQTPIYADIPKGKSGDELEHLLLRFPNVIMFVNGHTHSNNIWNHNVRFDNQGNQNGFWEVNTVSLVDWPVQARLIEVAEDNGMLSIFTTMLDADAPLTYWHGDANSPPDPVDSTTALQGLARELAANDPQERQRGIDLRRGTEAVRNTQLLLPAPFALANYGVPTARISQSVSGLNVSFSSSGSSDPNGSIVSWAWNFGDGTTSSQANPAKSYAMYGIKTVTLTVTDNNGNSNTATQMLSLQDPCGCSPLTSDVTVHAYRKVVTNPRTRQTEVTPARYSFYVPQGATSLTFSTTGTVSFGGTLGDADLYVKTGGVPALSSYTCRSATPGNAESCSFSNPAPGYWYVELLPAGNQLTELKADLTASYR